MEFTWKIGIALIFLCIIGLVIVLSLQSKECFDPNMGKYQRSNDNIKNTEITDPNKALADRTLEYKNPNRATTNGGAEKEKKNQEINDRLDNTLGSVLLEFSMDDTGDLLDGGNLEGVALHTLKCSPACCASQWPLPAELRSKTNTCNRDLVRSNYTCGNGSNSGCICLPRKNFNYLSRRGNNATWNDADR